MEGSWVGLVELALVFGLVIGFGIRELLVLRRDKRIAAAKKSEADQPPRRY